MPAWKQYAIWTIVVTAVIGVAILGLLGGPPGGARVTIGVGHQFTQVPTPRAMELLEAGAPAEEILAAVDQSKVHPDRIVYFAEPLLFWAVQDENTDVVIGLLERGACPDGSSGSEEPLGMAIFKEAPEIIEALIEGGADPSGNTRLMGLSSDNAEIRRMFEELSRAEGGASVSDRNAERRFNDDDQ
jgi:hypothetical protein